MTPMDISPRNAWVVLSDSDRIPAQLFGTSAFAPIRELFNSVFGDDTTNTSLKWNSTTQTVTWNGISSRISCRLINGNAWGSVRDFTDFIGWSISINGENITISKG